MSKFTEGNSQVGLSVGPTLMPVLFKAHRCLPYLTLPCACISDDEDRVSHSQQLLQLNNLQTEQADTSFLKKKSIHFCPVLSLQLKPDPTSSIIFRENQR